ncbi:YbaY family lipoprotein [Phaeobacter marinintestinus]|uniref:YbaY family lipoprotein n=1 Tax=Falsiphaeobacter marinintestinus TaxID=1492905 RepID=UPI0011B6F551|nr:YbaY family lipoprotein [Phaeobacter marinintestinus]
MPVLRTLMVLCLTITSTAAWAGVIQGSASYRERIAVPPDATLDVSLVDVSRQDVAATIVSTQTYALDRVPYDFELPFDDGLIDSRLTYSISAKVMQNGVVLYRSTSAYPVLTRGAGAKVDIMMERMQQAKAGPEIWTVVELRGRLLITDRLPTLEFGPDGKIGGTAGCNRYFGQVEKTQTDMTFGEAIGATRMACPPPYDKLERDFFEVLPDVATYVVTGDQMALVNSAGVTVMRLSR